MTSFRTILFDCDSTLTKLEGIDRLGAGRADLAELTSAAMSGRVALDDVYRRRLELVRPRREAVTRLAAEYLEHAVEDAHGVIGTLARAGCDVHIVSGGVLAAVVGFADALGLPATHVHAVDVRFDDNGDYAGFDEVSPLARSGGKEELLRSLAQRLRRPILFVGDGVTDLEAAPAVDLFVAFAGVVDRPQVSAAADVVIHCASLAPVLPLALREDEVQSADHALYLKGLHLMKQHVTDRRGVAQA